MNLISHNWGDENLRCSKNEAASEYRSGLRRKSRQGFPRRLVPVALRVLRGLLRRAVLDRSPSLLATGRTAFILMRQSMRRLYVGANVSPITYDVSPTMIPFKPVLLS